MTNDLSIPRNRTLRAGLLGFFGGVALAAGVAVLATGGVSAMHPMMGQMSQTDMAVHIEKLCQHLYIEVDATDAQKARLDPIFKQAANDLLPMFQQVHAGHAQIASLLTAPTIDRGALEQARATQMATMDQISQRMTQLVEDSGDVLTQDQRQKLATHLARHLSMGGPFHG